MFEEVPETPYGIKKRLQFMYGEIEKRTRNTEDKREIKVLDIGCGTGELITIPLGSLGVSVLGIDTHLPSIECARRENSFGNVQFECISLDELTSQQFDFIICSEVLEHLTEPIEMLHAIKRILKPDGIGIITIPNGYSLKETEVRIYKFLSNLGLNFPLNRSTESPIKTRGEAHYLRDTLNVESQHVQNFTYRHFRNLVEECGLSIVKEKNRRFLDGFLIKRILSKSKTLTNWNISVADKMPHFLASSWMFVIEQGRD